MAVATATTADDKNAVATGYAVIPNYGLRRYFQRTFPLLLLKPGKHAMRNGNPVVNSLVGIFLIPAVFLFGAGFLLLAAWNLGLKVVELSWWHLLFVPVLVAMSLFLLVGVVLFLYATITDLIKGSVELEGPVASKREEWDGGEGVDRTIQVRGRDFHVNKRIYRWVSKGDTVVVTFWPHTERVFVVRKRVEDTTHQFDSK